MKGDITEVINTLFEDYRGPNLPREVQLQRVRRVIREELSQCQREILTAYYFRQMTMEQIAAERGINKSTVCRTLHRAERIIRQCLKY